MGKPYNTNYNMIKNSDYNTDKDRVMMTNITYELRNFANSGMSAMECATYSDKLLAIADCIDIEYQKMLNEHNNSERFNALMDACAYILRELGVEVE